MTPRELREKLDSIPSDCQDSDIEFTVNTVDDDGCPHSSELTFKSLEAFTDYAVEMEFDNDELTH